MFYFKHVGMCHRSVNNLIKEYGIYKMIVCSFSHTEQGNGENKILLQSHSHFNNDSSWFWCVQSWQMTKLSVMEDSFMGGYKRHSFIVQMAYVLSGF